MRSPLSIVPIILAAGDSMRMGFPKALLPIGNDIFITRILSVIRQTGLAVPTIILGKAAAQIQPVIQGWPANVLINPDPSRGQLSSIQIGLSSLDPCVQAAMIWPVDQPAVSVGVVRELIGIFTRSSSLIAYPKCGEKRGHPAIFDRSLFCEFMDAPLEQGPKSIVSRHEGETSVFLTSEPATIQDIDTPAEYETLTGRSVEALRNKPEP